MELKANIYTCCQEINIIDTTGKYDVNLNPNGWPSATVTDIDSNGAVFARVSIGDTTKYYDLSSDFNDPNPENIEYSPIKIEVPDGIINVDLLYFESFNTATDSVEDKEPDYSYGIKTLNTANSECCLTNMLKDKLANCDPCKDKDYEELVIMDSLLYSLKTSFACMKDCEVKDILKKIQTYCGFEDCGCD